VKHSWDKFTYIYQEVLQGVKTEKNFITLKKYLGSQRFYELKHPKESRASAAKLYFDCRKTGVTINSAIDLIIAQTAIENDLFLLHNDSDYEKIAGITALKSFKI